MNLGALGSPFRCISLRGSWFTRYLIRFPYGCVFVLFFDSLPRVEFNIGVARVLVTAFSGRNYLKLRKEVEGCTFLYKAR